VTTAFFSSQDKKFKFSMSIQIKKKKQKKDQKKGREKQEEEEEEEKRVGVLTPNKHLSFTNLKEATTSRGGAEKNDAVLRAQTHRIPLFVFFFFFFFFFFRGSTARKKAVSSHFPSTQCHSSRDRASPQGFPVRNEKK